MEIESPYHFCSLFKVFRTAKIKNILADPEDDTNDDAKYYIEEFLKKVGDNQYFAFLDDWNNRVISADSDISYVVSKAADYIAAGAYISGKSLNNEKNAKIGRLLALELNLRQGNITPDEYEEALKEVMV
jgi:hypothetical protein